VTGRAKLGAAISAGILFLNGIALMHARAMTHFSAGGEKTRKPEELSLSDRIRVLATGVSIPRPINSVTPADFGLSYATHRFPSGASELEGWYIPASASRGRVLLFHGWAASKGHLLPAAEGFHDLGYATFLVDFTIPRSTPHRSGARRSSSMALTTRG
jgi:hypothetical protein